MLHAVPMVLGEKTAKIPCPGCKTEVEVQLKEISPGKSATCPGCGATLDFKGDDAGAAVKKLDDAIDRLKKLSKG